MNAVELARETANAINSFSFQCDTFCLAMDREHRTLQQSFTRLCVEWLKHCAEMEHCDGRNEFSVKIGRIVKEALEDNNISGIPMV